MKLIEPTSVSVTLEELKQLLKEGYTVYVNVDWLDADSEGGWLPTDPEADDSGKPLTSSGCVATVGYKLLTLSHSYNWDGEEWLGKHRIPLGMIEEVRVTELKKYTKEGEDDAS